VVEQAPMIFVTLVEIYVEADGNRDQATRDRLAWFTLACDEEFDETRQPPRRPLY
jgi:hypothetical protein